jgi:L-lactate dehydrogenase complex protein LldE
MKVGLFIPCYVEQLYPSVGMATVDVLERLGIEVDYPEAQTCCGQPMLNAGCGDAKALAKRFVEIFGAYEYVVCPSGSCVAMVRSHYRELVGDRVSRERLARVMGSTYELCEFLVDVVKIPGMTGRFAHKVGLHQSCHGLRELRLGSGTERRISPYSKVATLLSGLDGIELVELTRPDECCGFGGTFATTEEAVSCSMGRDRIADHERGGAEIVTSVDMSCLMHLGGLIQRQRGALQVMHVAEIFAAAAADPG